jgi:HSP20 family protein
MDVKSMVPWKRGKLVERDPFEALRREMNTLFDAFFSETEEPRGLMAFTPQVDVKETEHEIRVSAELPGMDEKDVEVSISGDVLTIKGEKKEEKEEKGEEGYRLERSYGAFRRSFSLPCEVDTAKATATYRKGVLTIALPKAAEAKKKATIAVKTA